MKERSGAFSCVGNLRFIRPSTQTHTHTQRVTLLNKEGLWVGGEGGGTLNASLVSHGCQNTVSYHNPLPGGSPGHPPSLPPMRMMDSSEEGVEDHHPQVPPSDAYLISI